MSDAPRQDPHGFTLIELMVVVSILAATLLLVPVNLYGFGARSRLENAVNTVVAAVGASRAQAVFDGYSAFLEVGGHKNEDGEIQWGLRWVVTNMPAKRSDELTKDDDAYQDQPKGEEREWITTNWFDFPKGVVLVGVSERSDSWKAVREERPYQVEFRPDGSVEKGFAIRIRSEDLDVDEDDRTFTIVVNPLTSEASSYEGPVELPPQRDENDFPR